MQLLLIIIHFYIFFMLRLLLRTHFCPAQTRGKGVSITADSDILCTTSAEWKTGMNYSLELDVDI